MRRFALIFCWAATLALGCPVFAEHAPARRGNSPSAGAASTSRGKPGAARRSAPARPSKSGSSRIEQRASPLNTGGNSALQPRHEDEQPRAPFSGNKNDKKKQESRQYANETDRMLNERGNAGNTRPRQNSQNNWSRPWNKSVSSSDGPGFVRPRTESDWRRRYGVTPIWGDNGKVVGHIKEDGTPPYNPPGNYPIRDPHGKVIGNIREIP